jgi:myo-inositol 2-dehydrogenase/D-chiro-inositol 1-dehydrogenase
MSDNARRTFLKATGGLLLLKPETVFGSQANSALSIGITGCGGRGNYVGGMFKEYTGARIAAIHDPFEYRLSAITDKLQLSGPRTYTGLDGYQELASSDVDAVVITSPPYWHPAQAIAAVNAGKHVYLAKPVAVDVNGCLDVLAAGRKAEANKLSFLTDFQTRQQGAFQEAATRVHRGDIGDLVLGHIYYHAGRLRSNALPNLSPAENRLRNWVFDKALSGDIIVEQNIHVIDVANWYANSHPVLAVGSGGRKARVDVGDCWDHFLVLYDYPGDVKVDFSSGQFLKGYSDLCMRFYGSRGTVDSHYQGDVRITGDNPWEGSEENTMHVGTSTNVRNFAQSVREGKPLNNSEVTAESNLTAILGRMAAYSRRPVTWDEMLASNEKLEAHLAL